MTLRKWQMHVAAILLLTGTPTLQGQDFLKQLEAKILKQQESKPKDSSSEKPTLQEPSPVPFELPSVLEPSGGTTPSLLRPKEEGSETLELPAPKPEPKAIAPTTKRSVKPATPPTSTPSTSTPPKSEKSAASSSRSLLSPSPFPKANDTSVPKLASPTGGGFLGLTVEAIPGGGFGLTVVEVAADSPAWRAGFRNGDKVVGVSGQAVSTVDAFADQLARFAPGTPVKFLVDRRGSSANLIAVLQDRRIAGQIHGARPGTVSPLEPELPTGTNRPGQAYLGINVSDMSDAYRRQFSIPAYRGASVTEVVPNSPAHSAGIRPGDCIVEIEGATVQNADVVFEAITRAKPGQVISISFYRGRQLNSSSVQLISANEDAQSAANIGPEMLTPEYVASLQGELERVHAELSETQARLQQLEARLQRIENKR